MKNKCIHFNRTEDDVIIGIYTYDNLYDQNQLDRFAQRVFEYINVSRQELEEMWERQYNRARSQSQ